MIGGPLEMAPILVGLACTVALILLLFGVKGDAMHRPKPKPKPPKPTPIPETERRIVTELHCIHTELREIKEAILKLSTAPSGDDQRKVDELAARLGKSTDRLDESTAPEPQE